MSKRILIFVATAVMVLAASAGTALGEAAPAKLCTKAGQPVLAPDANGQCKKGYADLSVATDSQVAELKGTIGSLTTRVAALEDANTALNNEVSTLQGRVLSLESDNTTLKSDVSALQTKLSKVSYDATGLNGLPTLRITGANLQIVSGSGTTYGTVNGLGNLIIGYDQNYGYDQTGSHNLILGDQQTFTSYAGVIGGYNNVLSAPESVVFGRSNKASGSTVSVTGGIGNTARDSYSSVSGGNGNTARYNASVLGGENNTAYGAQSSVSGGVGNTAQGDDSSVSGGEQNITALYAYASSILGGKGNTVTDVDGTWPYMP